jgi:WD40 repeat protein
MKLMLQSIWCFGHLLPLLVIGVCATSFAQPAPDVVWQSTATNSYILNPVALSPDGSVAATLGTNNTIQIWRMSDGIPVQALSGNGSWVGDLAFSPDGVYLASGGGDSSVRVWRTADWSVAYSIATSIQGPPVAFSPDSSTLAIGNGSAIQLRYATNGSLFQSWTATTGELTALAFSPDGSKLGSGAGIRGMDTALKIWASPSGSLLQTIPTAQTYGIGRVLFSPDGLQVLTGSQYLYSGPMQSWQVSDGLLLRTFPLAAYAMAFSKDGTVLAAVGTNIMFFRASDGAVMQVFSDGFAGFTQGEKGIALAPAGGLFIRSRGLGGVLVGLIPVLISSPSIEGGQMVIQWVGGTGLYKLQRSLAFGVGWQDVGGILTSNSAIITPDVSSAFYRVVALPQ